MTSGEQIAELRNRATFPALAFSGNGWLATAGADAAMNIDQYKNALRKYVEEALDLYFDLSSDTYDRAEYGSPRQAMHSTKFFSKITQELDNRIASLKKTRNTIT